jgi:hypothetical protein
MMIIIQEWRLERKGYRPVGYSPPVSSRTGARFWAADRKAPRPGNPVRRFQLPLLGSNQDSPDPEGPL